MLLRVAASNCARRRTATICLRLACRRVRPSCESVWTIAPAPAFSIGAPRGPLVS
jgi:hypothetical protein